TLVTGLVSLFNLGLLFWYSWRLAMISVFLVGMMLAVIVFLLARQLGLEAMIRKVEGSIISFLLEIVGGMTKLRTAGAENRAFGRWAARYADQLGLIIESRRYTRGLHLFLAIFPMLIAIVIYFGTIHLGPDRLSTGNFLALSIALANVITAVLAVGYTLLDLLDLPPLYDRVKPILEAQPEFPAAVLEPVRLGGALALGAVSFRYPGQDEGTKVLSDVSLQVRPGEFVAIVGPSGSGKSTIMRLLLGFETPDAGTVTYDGRELSTLDLREVRRPRILMFDEATSALDNLTQAIVTESITRELRGITRVVIAHRLTTVIDADRIYVVKQGQIVQSGEYQQLLAEPGPFQELVHRQSI